MGSHAAPSGGSASDDWTKPGRTRSKARGSTRADAPADSALRQYMYFKCMPTSIHEGGDQPGLSVPSRRRIYTPSMLSTTSKWICILCKGVVQG